MQTLFKIAREGNTLKIGFGETASNDAIVAEVASSLDRMIKDGQLEGGPLVKVDGPASLPVAFAIAHALNHRFGVVAVKDPKLGKFVVAVSHDPASKPGDLIE